MKRLPGEDLQDHESALECRYECSTRFAHRNSSCDSIFAHDIIGNFYTQTWPIRDGEEAVS